MRATSHEQQQQQWQPFPTILSGPIGEIYLLSSDGPKNERRRARLENQKSTSKEKWGPSFGGPICLLARLELAGQSGCLSAEPDSLQYECSRSNWPVELNWARAREPTSKFMINLGCEISFVMVSGQTCLDRARFSLASETRTLGTHSKFERPGRKSLSQSELGFQSVLWLRLQL